MSARLARPALAVGVIAAFALSGVASAAPAKRTAVKKASACTSWTDPAGDASPGGAGAGADKTMDITAVTYSVTDKDFVAKLAVPGYSDSHSESFGARFTAEMKVAGHAVIIYAQHSPATDVEKNVFFQSGVSVDGTQAAGSDSVVTFAAAGGTVTLSVGLKDLGAAIGTKLNGATPVEAPVAKSRGTYVALLSTFDTAAAPDGTKFAFTPCA